MLLPLPKSTQLMTPCIRPCLIFLCLVTAQFTGRTQESRVKGESEENQTEKKRGYGELFDEPSEETGNRETRQIEEEIRAN